LHRPAQEGRWAPHRRKLGGVARHWKLRAATLLTAGTYGLHQLRYAIGYGVDSHRALASQGHAYLQFAAPMLAVLLLLCLVELAHRVVRARAADGASLAPSLRTLWMLATGSLLSSYCVQELIEGSLSPGHPAGLAGLFGGSGWVAVPLGATIGLVVALLLRGAARAIAIASEPSLRFAVARSIVETFSPRGPFSSAGSTLARHIGGRAPPPASV
jgi:hypothetical protein